jgi:two-component system LytT family response regulator
MSGATTPTALIVDDEEPCRRGIRLLLASDPDVRIVAECASGSDAIACIRAASPDIVFLDIHMPEVSGFDVIDAIGPERMPLVVFVTAFDAHAIKAFEVHAVDYVLKPFSRARFADAVAKAKRRVADRTLQEYGRSLVRLVEDLAARGQGRAVPQGRAPAEPLDRILIKDREGYRFLPVSEILWIEGADYCINLHCQDRVHVYRGSLAAVEARLPTRFARIHRSAIVNIGAIREMKTGEQHDLVIVLRNGHRLKVSKRRKVQLLALWEARYSFK